MKIVIPALVTAFLADEDPTAVDMDKAVRAAVDAYGTSNNSGYSVRSYGGQFEIDFAHRDRGVKYVSGHGRDIVDAARDFVTKVFAEVQKWEAELDACDAANEAADAKVSAAE